MSLKQGDGRKMVQLADLFSVPEMYLLCAVTEFFNKNHIDYHPEILFSDVKVGDEGWQKIWKKGMWKLN